MPELMEGYAEIISFYGHTRKDLLSGHLWKVMFVPG